ncbi:MAG: type II toxin-antitoxin system Phd/YefM family antitoxin [Desulfomicrobium sp.]
MKFSSQVKPISYLKSHAAEVAATLAETRRPLVVTQNGEARLVVMDVRTYEEQEETMALLKLLALGNKDVEKSAFRSAEDVFRDLHELDQA